MRDFPEIPADFKSALMLYGCAFDGLNDCVHVRRAGLLDVTVVDNDPAAIERMRPKYPAEWKFKLMDVDDVLIQPKRYDLIVADPFGGNDMDHVHQDLMPALLRMMPKMLVVGSYTPALVPEGVEQVVRNERYCWWVWRML